MFKEWLEKNDLRNCLPKIEPYHPFPDITNRKAWENVDPDVRQTWIAAAEKFLYYDWPALPATFFMEYKRSGDREIYEQPHFARRRALGALVVAECMENKGRFIDDIINGVWAICEESFWGVSAHNSMADRFDYPLPDTENPFIDLFAAETAGLLVFTRYLAGPALDKVTPQITRRIDLELESRIQKPFIEHEDFWWMGFTRKTNNWCPWILSNVLTVFLLNERDPYRRVNAVAKAFRCLDCFLDGYHDDGGCDEGTTYWNVAGGALFDCLEQLYIASDGKINFYKEELIRQIGRFLYRSFICDDATGRYYINFADGAAKAGICSNMVWQYGVRIKDKYLQALALSAPSRPTALNPTESLRRALPAIFSYREFSAAKTKPLYVKDVWMDGIQVMAARQEESQNGLYLAAKGGNNDESHNHNDVGSFIVYKNGVPLLIDVGVETYTRFTFSEHRYEIWTMQSQYHNLPVINGQMQFPGKEAYAKNVTYRADDACVQFELDLEETYPKAAGLHAYHRTCSFSRKENASISITDHFAFKQADNVVTLCLMSWKKPSFTKQGEITFALDTDTSAVLHYDGGHFAADMDVCPTKDAKLYPVWGDQVYRIRLTAQHLPQDFETTIEIQ